MKLKPLTHGTDLVPGQPVDGAYSFNIITRFPSGKRLGEWRKNETKTIQRETNTTTPEIENKDRFRIPGTNQYIN